jgi:sugar-specific transcriptional regulator TrmB
MQTLVRELVNLGLSEKEAEVYLALLEIGPASVLDAAEKSGVHRTTVYQLVEALIGKGIVSQTVRGQKQLLVAEPPERLVTLLRLQRTAIDEKERELMDKLPMFRAVYNSKTGKPTIRYFDGANSLKEMRKLLFSGEDGGECIQILPIDEANDIPELVEARPDHIAELEKRQIRFRTLVVTDNPSQVPTIMNAEYRFIRKADFPIEREITVFGNNILLFCFKPMSSVVITSQHFADTIRALFELAWKSEAGKNASGDGA